MVNSAWRFEPPAAKAGTAPLAGLMLLALLPLAAMGFRRGLLFAVLLAPTFVLAPAMLSEAMAQTNNTVNDPRWQAVAGYRGGQHEEVLRLLTPFDDAVSHYNRGNALMRLERFAEAEEAYATSLAQRPDDADTKFNLALAKRLRPPPPSPPPKSPPPRQARVPVRHHRPHAQAPASHRHPRPKPPASPSNGCAACPTIRAASCAPS